MSFERGPKCPPAVEVERHAVGETSAWRGHIEGCALCTAHATELRAASAAFARQRPAELFLKQLARRAERPKATRPFLSWVLGGAVAVACVALFVLAPWTQKDDGLRMKGGQVEVYFKRGAAEPARLLDGASLEPGDTLRFRFRGAHPTQLAILEQDSTGAVTVFAPFGKTRSIERSEGLLDDTVAVDATLGPTRLYFIQSSQPFELGPLIEAVHASRSPSCNGCKVDLLRYEKVP